MKQLILVCEKCKSDLQLAPNNTYYCSDCDNAESEKLELEKLSHAIRLALLYGMDNAIFADLFFRYTYSPEIPYNIFAENIADEYGPHVSMGWQLFELAYNFSMFTKKHYCQIASLYFFTEKKVILETKK